MNTMFRRIEVSRFHQIVFVFHFCIFFPFLNEAYSQNSNSEPASVVTLWPNGAPEWDAPSEPEYDKSTPDDNRIADRTVIRLTNVSSPELHIYSPSAEARSETVVVVCPGGGYRILAWDLEGTEIAEWLQGIGVTAVVCKYRVPNDKANEEYWKPPVQDIQRSISLVRSGAAGFKPKFVGTLGFSAGGNASARAALAQRRYYDPVDSHDEASATPDFAVLVYPAWLTEKNDLTQLNDALVVTPNSPPMFFAHAADDRISCMNSVTLFSALHQQEVPSALNIFSSGGHGFGARVSDTADDHWPTLAEAWMRDQGWLAP